MHLHRSLYFTATPRRPQRFACMFNDKIVGGGGKYLIHSELQAHRLHWNPSGAAFFYCALPPNAMLLTIVRALASLGSVAPYPALVRSCFTTDAQRPTHSLDPVWGLPPQLIELIKQLNN